MILKVTETHRGGYYKASLDGQPLTEDQFQEITGIQPYRRTGLRLSRMLTEWVKHNPEYELDIYEIDIS